LIPNPDLGILQNPGPDPDQDIYEKIDFFTIDKTTKTPKRTFRLQEKPSALERALQTLNAVIFLLFLRTIFACLSWNWI
jgi:hypothetical protein